jgi:hypothetical protein
MRCLRTAGAATLVAPKKLSAVDAPAGISVH